MIVLLTCVASRLENETREMFSCISFSIRLKGSIVRSCERSSCECFRISMSFSSSCSYEIVYFTSKYITIQEKEKEEKNLPLQHIGPGTQNDQRETPDSL